MSLTQNHWFRRVGFATIAALGLGASAMMASPAQAHEYGHRVPVVTSVQHASFFPRFFFGFGHHWHHGGHGDYHRR